LRKFLERIGELPEQWNTRAFFVLPPNDWLIRTFRADFTKKLSGRADARAENCLGHTSTVSQI
jgi:hypothetical protein